ncbi:hypothetical protein [Hyphococcus sp. DH-69]|uniref:hypothetical protein n=1 Tax=Hyphococcus formosus TaxID=3143534 RepID=UPI00398BB10E
MKKRLTLIAAAGFAMSALPAFASELEANCEAYAEANGTDPSGCSCLADTADASVADELSTVETEADLELISDDAKAAIQACWPDA